MELRYYEGKYYQGTMSDVNAKMVLEVQKEKEIPALKNCIKNLSQDEIDDLIKSADEYEKEKGNLDGFVTKHYEGNGTLRPYQTTGVAFMYYAGSCLLGDEVGLGKTVQIAGLCNLLRLDLAKVNKKHRYLFLTEKSNVGQIRDKLVQFTGEYVGMLENGEEPTVMKYIAKNKGGKNYSMVGGHSLLTSASFITYLAKHPFDTIVVDESSILKNVTSAMFESAKSVFKYHERVILLNATPLEQEAREFYNQLLILDKNYMPNVGEFQRQYCTMTKGMFGFHVTGYKNEAVFRRAISLRYYARTRKELGANYQGNGYKVILVPQSIEQKRLLARTTLYQMANDYPPGVDREIPCTRETTPKIDALLTLISESDEGERFIIYSNFIDCQSAIKEHLAKEGRDSVILNGTIKAKDRLNIINSFNDGTYDIIITNVKKGVDLKNCNNCVLYTIDPNPQKMVQVEGRITRGFDITEKSLYLLVSMGKEKKFVEEVLGTRVEASTKFTNTSNSMVLKAIRDVASRGKTE